MIYRPIELYKDFRIIQVGLEGYAFLTTRLPFETDLSPTYDSLEQVRGAIDNLPVKQIVKERVMSRIEQEFYTH